MFYRKQWLNDALAAIAKVGAATTPADLANAVQEAAHLYVKFLNVPDWLAKRPYNALVDGLAAHQRMVLEGVVAMPKVDEAAIKLVCGAYDCDTTVPVLIEVAPQCLTNGLLCRLLANWHAVLWLAKVVKDDHGDSLLRMNALFALAYLQDFVDPIEKSDAPQLLAASVKIMCWRSFEQATQLAALRSALLEGTSVVVYDD